MKKELENKNKTISYLTAEKLSLVNKTKRMRKPQYEEDLQEVVTVLKEKVEKLKAKIKKSELDNQGQDMLLTRAINKTEEDKYVKDAKLEIVMYKKHVEEKTKALEKVKKSRNTISEKRKQLDEWMEALKKDIDAKGIDFKKVAENVSAEVKKDDFEREKEELYKKKGILLKTIETNKRFERDIQKLKMEELQLDRKSKAYSK